MAGDLLTSYTWTPKLPPSSRRRLLHKLEHADEIRGILLCWISAFLTGRSFRILLGSDYSSSWSIFSGVPQWSILGPLLFLVYFADVPLILNLQCSFFVDDAIIYAYSLSRLSSVVVRTASCYTNFVLLGETFIRSRPVYGRPGYFRKAEASRGSYYEFPHPQKLHQL